MAKSSTSTRLHAPAQPETDVRFCGLPISEGVVRARVCLIESNRHYVVPFYKVAPESVPAEKRRLLDAINEARTQLETLVDLVAARVGQVHANIFSAQKLMLEDPALLDELTRVLEGERVNAETAVETVLDRYQALLLAASDEYIRERAADLGELRGRLLDLLHEAPSNRALPGALGNGEQHIVVAHELTPSETVALDTDATVGFVTEHGGAGSHAAILARALGIPAVSGVEGVMSKLSQGDEILLNGTTGDIILRPTAATLELYPTARRIASPRVQSVAPAAGIVVMANISQASEVEAAAAARAEGIGLYRTEIECFAAGRILNEDEQYEHYASVVRAMEGKPVYIRLFDFGGDKKVPFLDVPVEENPCLGFRGARLLLGRPDLLITQARAITRAAAHGPIHVIYPLIVDLDQFLKLREIFWQKTSDLPQGDLKHGIMFEVPSACMDAEPILEVAEFGSIGSNDLIQYLFAVDRNNELVADDYNADRPVLWRLLESIAEAGRRTGRTISLCGEMGGQPQHLTRLVELGITNVSVSPRRIGLARMAVKRLPRK